ncbi:hypothetical protein QA641_13450 [Bradyrhizobium sp. CB1650]|uniref:hypothetical protein n=1 Tax=Bradyrhizobium sp. CB1650 TaxID=3039153 RepID=UPI002435DCC5|nr:hypothetical protein [Bradyrhizobium sp. CB1650]WGD54827.1 hypothetical protein QA641_13450 [Bradyrhizobium sp. CB1650]
MTARCVLIIPDAGPINSLWVAGELPLLLKFGMQVVLIDQVYAELTSDPDNYLKDREVKEFVEAHLDLFKIEKTNVGKMAAAMREQGTFETGQSLGEAAIADFFQHGLEKYVRDDQAALLLFEDSDIRSVKVIRIPRNVHILSTVAWLRGLQDLGIVASADDVIRAMTHPTDPGKRPRKFNDLPDGIDEPAEIGSTWKP